MSNWMRDLAPLPAPVRSYTFAGSHGWVTVEPVGDQHKVSGQLQGESFEELFACQAEAWMAAKMASFDGVSPAERRARIAAEEKHEHDSAQQMPLHIAEGWL